MTAQDLALRLRRATPEQLQIFSEGYLLLDAANNGAAASYPRCRCVSHAPFIVPQYVYVNQSYM